MRVNHLKNLRVLLLTPIRRRYRRPPNLGNF
jgi:hypothetical protein